MRKLVFIVVALLTVFGTSSVFAAGWHTERWIDENGIHRIRVVDDHAPVLTDQQLRDMRTDAKMLRPSDYYDFDLIGESPFGVELRQRGTGKVITIHK